MRTRHEFSDDFRAKVALEVLRGDLKVQEIAARHKVHPNQVSTWKRQAVDGMSSLFFDKREKASSDRDREVHELHMKIGQLTVERDFLADRLKR